jgi:hypothetical protein
MPKPKPKKPPKAKKRSGLPLMWLAEYGVPKWATYLISILVVLLVGAAAVLFYKYVIINQSGSTTSQIETPLYEAAMSKQHAAYKNSFTIDWPTRTTTDHYINDDTIKFEATEYDAAVDDKLYLVQITTYLDLIDTTDIVGRYNLYTVSAEMWYYDDKGETILLDDTEFLGYQSVDGHYKIKFNGEIVDQYTRLFQRDQTIFEITTLDVPHDDFLRFVESFRFKS